LGHAMTAKGSLEQDIMLGQVAGCRENHRCTDLTARKLLDYGGIKRISTGHKKMAHAGGRKDLE